MGKGGGIGPCADTAEMSLDHTGASAFASGVGALVPPSTRPLVPVSAAPELLAAYYPPERPHREARPDPGPSVDVALGKRQRRRLVTCSNEYQRAAHVL